MCDWLFATAKRLNLFVAGENELTITTMTAPRPLGRNGALLAAFCLSFAAMSALQQQRLQAPSVAMRTVSCAMAEPPRASAAIAASIIFFMLSPLRLTSRVCPVGRVWLGPLAVAGGV